MEFEWDPVKARDNEAKHKVSFSEATEIFADNLSSSAADPDHSIAESVLPYSAGPSKTGIWSSRSQTVVVDSESSQRGK